MSALDLLAAVPFAVAAMASLALVVSMCAVPVVRVVRVVVPRAPSRGGKR